MTRLGQLSDPSTPTRPTVPHEPVFVREMRKAFKEARGLE